MKTILQYYAAICTALLITSCGGQSDAPAPEPVNPSHDAPEIRIAPTVADTRTTDNPDTRATDFGFETGDCIGLYVVNYSGSTPGTLTNSGNQVDNMRFTYNGDWIPDSPVYWNDNNTHADFYLYYPYASVQSVTAHPFNVRADQSTEAAYKASDLLVGKTLNVSPSASATTIPVSHSMSRIIIWLEAGNGFTAQALADASVAVRINGVRCEATVNIATGAVTPKGNPVSVTPLYADNAYKALIVPQSVEEGNLITVTVDGRDFNLKRAFTFESAKSHKFTVTLSKTSNGVNVNINPWIDDNTDHGGTAE